MRSFIKVFILCSLAASLPLQAAEAESQLKTCRAIEDDAQRVKCYDDYADTTAGYMEDKFGKAKIEDVPEEQTFKVTSAEWHLDRLIIELDNGQVWRQTSTNKNYRLAAGDEVLIKSGFFSAYFLSKVGSSTRIKVQRIK